MLLEKENSPPVRKRRQSSILAGTTSQPIGDSPLRRNNKTATRRECTISMSVINSSLSRYCTNHGREPVEQYSESLSFIYPYHWNIF